MQRVHFIDGMSNGDGFDPSRDMDLLEVELEKLPALRLLILDPIVSAVAGDSHRNAETRRSLQPLIDLLQRRRCAGLGITHFTKGTAGRDPVERITGSLAFAALARLVLVAAKIKPEPGDEGEPRRVLMRAKSNISADDGGFAYELERTEVAPGVEGQCVRWLEALQGTARDLLADAEANDADPDGDSTAGADAFLLSLLADGPLPAKTIKADADGAGYAWRTVQRAGNRIGAERRKDGLRGGWIWALNASDTKAPMRYEGAEDAGNKSLAPTAPSASVVAPSDEAEVF